MGVGGWCGGGWGVWGVGGGGVVVSGGGVGVCVRVCESV